MDTITIIAVVLAYAALGVLIAALWQVHKSGNRKITNIMRAGIAAIIVGWIVRMFLGSDENLLAQHSGVILGYLGYVIFCWGGFLLAQDYRRLRRSHR